MSLEDSGKQERIEEFLRKSLLGEQLINTQFHLFSAASSCRLTQPRVLCANNILLAKSSSYFLDLLSSDISPSDPSLSDLTDVKDIPSNIQIDEYSYGSDSDLDDDDGEPAIPIADTEIPKTQSAMISPSPLQISVPLQPKNDDELSEDGSESVSSDMFVMSPEHPRMDKPFITDLGRPGSIASSETAVHDTRDSENTTSHTSMRLRHLESRHILVKDTAFQTWYTLLNYLYTGKINFLPLSSATPGGQAHGFSTSSLDEPRCSAKSMYRLARKVGLDHLCDEALAHIRNNLTEENILKELSCSLASKHSQLLEMELDVLYTHIASPPVVTGFLGLAQRIANKELLHGADIIVGIHERLLKGRQPLPSTSTSPKLSSRRSPLSLSLDPPGSPRELSTPVVRDLNDTTEPSTSTYPLPPPPLDPPGSLFELQTPVTRDLNSTTEHESGPSRVSECNGKLGLSEEPSATSGLLFDEESLDGTVPCKKGVKRPGGAVKNKKKK